MKNPIRSVIFALIYSLILLELGLWISGKFMLWQRRERTVKQASVQLVCIGDSHTFGIGTVAPYSYPKQLEKLLNSNNPGQKFSVINLGVPAANTKIQSETLQFFFKHHRVDGVLWLTGRNNHNASIKLFGNRSLIHKISGFLFGIKSVRFFEWVLACLSGKNASLEIHEPSGASRAYVDYMDFYLETVRRLCKARGAKLVLLSYYNSADIAVKEFADKHGVLFFDFRDDFSLFRKKSEAAQYISPDRNHMNRFGYQFYSERLYEDMFLHQKRLGLRLGPLLKKMRSVDFYADPVETEKYVRSQQERVEQSKGAWTYPFEQIQLGHIYSEIGREESAKQCFVEGLIASNYSNNNVLVSPIIAWHLKRGERQEALQWCDDIISKNPRNNIAKAYREILSQGSPSAWTSRLRSSVESIDQ
ncbi:MAG: SGNH/GDSL hydrolase family protein [Candidatus Omnitrophota bacterium]